MSIAQFVNTQSIPHVNTASGCGPLPEVSSHILPFSVVSGAAGPVSNGEAAALGGAGVPAGAGRLLARGRRSSLDKRESHRFHHSVKVLSEAEKQRLRQSHRAKLHGQLVRSLREVGLAAEAHSVYNCGRAIAYEGSECGRGAARQYFTCHNKLCVFCADRRADLVADKVTPIVQSFSSPIYLVLTVKNGSSLAERDKHLRSSFSKLLRDEEFRAAIRGGMVFWETTNEGKGWHPHLNVLADGYIGQALLSAKWEAITGDSRVVWVERVDEGTIREACKYPGKLTDIVGSPELVGEFLAVTKGRNMLWSFGSARGLQKQFAEDLRAAEAADAAAVVAGRDVCPYCGPESSCHMERKLTPEGGPVWLSRAFCAPLGGGWLALPGDSPPACSSGPPSGAQGGVRV